MDVNQLRHELTQGIRLPNPEFCPGQITDVIQRCFAENPNDRPDFKNIKSLIEAAYVSLMETRAQTNKDIMENEEKVELLYQNEVTLQVPKDEKMKERYLNMRSGNKKHENNDSVFGEDPSEDVQATKNDSLRTKRRRYISLDNVYSSASMTPFHSSQRDLTNAGEMPTIMVSSDYQRVSTSSNKYKQLSPGSNDMKSFFSTSAVNTMEPMEPQAPNQKFTQSWNPLYMMVSSGLNLDKSADEIALTDIDGSDSVGSIDSSKPIIKEQRGGND